MGAALALIHHVEILLKAVAVHRLHEYAYLNLENSIAPSDYETILAMNAFHIGGYSAIFLRRQLYPARRIYCEGSGFSKTF